MDERTKNILRPETQILILENLPGFKITLAAKYNGPTVYYGTGRTEIMPLIKDGAPFVRITDGSVTEGNFSDITKKRKGLLYIFQDSPESERYGKYGKCLYTLTVLGQESMYETTSPFKKHRSSKKKSTRRKKRSTRKTSTRRV
jgi:hypothetical protein